MSAKHTPGPWEDHAKLAVEAIQAAIEPRLKRVADDVYADLLYSVQDYLLSNVLGNVRGEIEAAHSQANYDRQRALKAEGNVRHLSAAVRMCIRCITHPELSPDANVVVERALALLAEHGGAAELPPWDEAARAAIARATGEQ